MNLNGRQSERQRFLCCSGGRVENFDGEVLGDQGGDEIGGYPGSGEFWVLGRQPTQFGEALEPLYGEFDLPAQAIEIGDLGGVEDVGRDRRDEDQMLGSFESGGAQGVDLALGGPAEPLLSFGCCLWRERHDDEPGRDQLELGLATMGDLDRLIEQAMPSALMQ